MGLIVKKIALVQRGLSLCLQVVLCLGIALPLWAGEIQSLQSIRDVVSKFVDAEHAHSKSISLSTSQLDNRLRLQRCSRKLEAFWSPGARPIGNTTVGVKCNGDKPWKIYVPVYIEAREKVWVANRHLTRGETLVASDASSQNLNISAHHRGYITDINKFIGYELKRSIKKGGILTPRSLEAPKLVKRGEKVILLAATNGVEIRMSGTALSDGSEGISIKVRNLSSRRIIEGIVIAPGIVKVRI